MIWDYFIYFAVASLVFWIAGSIMAFRISNFEIPNNSFIALATGSLIFASFILWMWISGGRPPLRTMGETRLWYSFFLSVIGILIFVRWKYRWIPAFSTMMAAVFIMINLLKPEIHTKALMPALQSLWFVPHVVVYMFAYAMLSASFLLTVYMLLKRKKQSVKNDILVLEELVRVGFAFLTIGMTFGSLWAKVAWGHFWTWDPKETWALFTWLAYWIFLFIIGKEKYLKVSVSLSLLGFICLQICWIGVKYLPFAQQSLHIYYK